MKKIIKGEFQKHVDHKTGEITQESSFTVIKLPQEPDFIKLYIKDLCSFFGVNNSDQSLLRHLLVRLDYDGYVNLSPRIRKSISRSLSISEKTFRNRLNSLVKANLIKPTSRNEYFVNPNYFARGSWKKVCEMRESYSMTLTYSENGRSVKTGVPSGDAHLEGWAGFWNTGPKTL